MAQGEHTHEWHYNEAREVAVNSAEKGTGLFWEVVAFCPICREVEVIDLRQTK